MGIDGLWNIFKARNVTGTHVPAADLAGKRLAIDGYYWLHQCLYASAVSHGRGHVCLKYANSFVGRARTLIALGIRLVLVFDGEPHPAKAATAEARNSARNAKLELAMKCDAEGDAAEARRHYIAAIRVTARHVHTVLQCMHALHMPRCWDAFVAPHEADGQIIHLSRIGQIDGAFAEDSDLLVNGVTLFRGDIDHGYTEWHPSCIQQAFPLLRPCDTDLFGVLCGCDYLKSPTGIGPVAVYAAYVKALTERTTEDSGTPIPKFCGDDILAIVSKYPAHICDDPASYAKQAAEALLSMREQYVCCPLLETVRVMQNFEGTEDTIAPSYYVDRPFAEFYRHMSPGTPYNKRWHREMTPDAV